MSAVKTVSAATEQEVFVTALCVDSVWIGDAQSLDVNKSRLLAGGWPRALGVLLLANKQLLAYLERNGSVGPAPRDLIDLATHINSWLPPIFQLPGDVVIDAVQMVANPFSTLAQKNLVEHTEEVFMDWLFLLAGLCSHTAEIMGANTYTVLLRTLSSLDNLPTP